MRAADIGYLEDRFLSGAGAGGNCARPMRLPDPSPVLDKNRAPMGPEILSSTGAGVWRNAPITFPHSSSELDTFQSANIFPKPCDRDPPARNFKNLQFFQTFLIILHVHFWGDNVYFCDRLTFIWGEITFVLGR